MRYLTTVALLTVLFAPVAAADRDDFNRRAAAADAAAFRELDRDRDGRLTREETRSSVDFSPRFDDFDVNRDGVVTTGELALGLERIYGMPAAESLR